MADEVKLSSLRVSATLDASGYKAGASQVESANQSMIQSGRNVSVTVSDTQAKISQSGDVFARLARQLVDGYAAQQRYAQSLQQISSGFERGRLSMQQAELLLGSLVTKYGQSADAAQFAARGQIDFADAVQRANQLLSQQQQLSAANTNLVGSFQGVTRAGQNTLNTSTSGLSVTELQKLEQAGRNFGTTLDQSFATVNKSARESAAVFEMVAREEQQMEVSAARLRAELDPMAAAMDRANAEIAEYSNMLSRGAISAEEFAAAQQLALNKAQQVSRINPGTGRNASNLNAFGAFNTGQQVQDIAVTAAMGQSIPTIALQQGLQLGTALQIQLEGAKKAGLGLGQALTGAFTSLLSPINLIAIGITAVVAAGIQFATRLFPGVEDLDKLMEKHAKTVADLKGSYEEVTKSAAGYAGVMNDIGKSQTVTLREQEVETERLAQRLEKEAKAIQDSAAPGVSEDTKGLFMSDLSRIHAEQTLGPVWDEVQKLNEAVAKGATPNFRQFALVMAEIANDDSFSDTIRDEADRLRELGKEAYEAQVKLKEMQVSFREAENASMQAYSKFLITQQATLDQMSKQAGADLLSTFARSPEELAATARAQEAAVPPQGDESEAVRSLRIELAGKKALIEATEQLRQAEEERAIARKDLITSTQLEFDAIQMTVGEEATKRKEMELTQEAERDALENHVQVSDETRREIGATSKAYGDLQEAIAETQALQSSNNAIEMLRLETELVNADTAARLKRIAALKSEQTIKDARIDPNSDAAETIRSNDQEEAVLNPLKSSREFIKDTQSDIEMLRLETELVGANGDERLRRVAAMEAEQRIQDLGIKSNSKEADTIRAITLEKEKLNAVKQAREDIQSRQEEIELQQLELSLMGESENARSAAIEMLKTEQDIRQRGIDLYGEEANKLRDQTKALTDLAAAQKQASVQSDLLFESQQALRSETEQLVASTQRAAGQDYDPNNAIAQQVRLNEQIKATKKAWEEVFDTVNTGVDSMVDALFDGTDDWGETLKKIGRDFARQMFDMAITNPLKNWLTGSNFSTVGDLFPNTPGMSSGKSDSWGGVLGDLTGASKAISSMQVQAATVIVNGSVVPGSGIPGIPGSSGLTFPEAPTSAGATALTSADGLGVMSSTSTAPVSVPGAGQWTTDVASAAASAAGSTGQWSVDTHALTSGYAGAVGELGTKSAAKAVDIADDLLGLNEVTNASTINSFLKAGGVDLNAAQNAWCAAFVNSSLKQVGVDGTNSQVATSFLNWGKGVEASDVMKGDVLVEARGLSAGEIGGHVGLATGETRGSGSGLELEMLSGNSSNEVQKTWEKASQVSVRRATDSIDSVTTAATTASDALKQVTVSGVTVSQSLVDAAGGLSNFGSVLNSFMASPQGGGSSWFSGLSSMFGGSSGALNYMTSISPGATASILGAGGGFTGLYHTGGIAGSPSQMRYVDMGVFANAQRYHNGGLAGDEVPAILRRGEPVFKSMAHAKQMVGNDNTDVIAAIRGLKLQVKNVNVNDPSIVGDYLHKDEAEALVVNIMRRNKGQIAQL